MAFQALKQQADTEFRTGQFRLAIEHYSEALESPQFNAALTEQQKRTLLSNRAQAYLSYGSTYDAVVDCDQGLSPLYLTVNTDANLSAKLYYRRAKAKEILCDYEQARADFARFEELANAIGRPIAAEDRQVMDQIQRGLNLVQGSPALERVWLIRAVQARGLLLSHIYRDDFPYSRIDGAGVEFLDDVSPQNYLQAPLQFTFRFNYPYLNHPTQVGKKFGGTLPVPEDMTLGESVEGMIQGSAIEWGPPRLWIMQGLEHADAQQSQLIVMTKNARILSIPFTTTVADIWPAVRWPRAAPSPFNILRDAPPISANRIDGLIFEPGSLITVYVVENVNVQAFVNQLDEAMNSVRM